MPITCPHCKTHFPKSDSINSRHKAKCLGTSKPVPCLCGHESTSMTQMKRHRSSCETWKSRDKKAVQVSRLENTLASKYGVTNPRHLEDAEARRKVTVKARYGADNVFSRESSLFETVQEAAQAHRTYLTGSDNHFSSVEGKAKVRAGMLAKHGAENPQQVPEIRAMTLATNLERYGSEQILAAPEIREKIKATNEVRYGGAAPSCSPEVVEKARQTNLERWGVEWTGQHPDIRRKQLETHEAKYGSHFFASEDGLRKIRESMVAKYGVESHTKVDGYWERQVKIFVERYGVTHPLQLAEFLDKRRDTCQARFGVDNPIQSPEVYAKITATNRERYGVDHFSQTEGFWEEKVFPVFREKYGVDHPLQLDEFQEKQKATVRERFGADYISQSQHYKDHLPEIQEKIRQTNIKNWGVPHPMMNQEYARKHLEKMRLPGPNMLERRFASMFPELLYTGDGSFWRWLPSLKQHKNPDFILPGLHPDKPKKGVTKVIELFGDFWHSKMFTGKANFDHEQDLVDAFNDIGISCLVIWESEFKVDPEGVRSRVVEHLHIGTSLAA